MKRRVCWICGCLVLAVSATALAGDTDADVTIVNNSDWAIYQLFLSPTSENEWGPDQLGDAIIPPNGGTFLLHSIPCTVYDVKVVDEDGDTCVIGQVPLCAESHRVTITNGSLLRCEGYGE